MDDDDDREFMKGLEEELDGSIEGSIDLGGDDDAPPPKSAAPAPKTQAAKAASQDDDSLGLSLSGEPSGLGAKPASKPASKAPSVAGASRPAAAAKPPAPAAEDSLGLSLSGDADVAASRPASRLASRSPSVAATRQAATSSPKPPTAEDSLGVSLSGDLPASSPPSKPPSKAPSIAGTPSPAQPAAPASVRPASVAPSVSGSVRTAPASATPQPGAASASRPATAASYQSDEYDDILGSSAKKLSISGSGGVSGTIATNGAPTPRMGSPAVQTANGGSFSPNASAAYTPPGSATPTLRSRMGSTAGSMYGSGLHPPEATDSPYASRAGGAGVAAAGARSRTLRTAGPYGSATLGEGGLLSTGKRSEKGRRLELNCDKIPTPFELFRLYDADESGCVTHAEFLHLLRDMDGLPLHFAPDEDPEHQLAVLQAKRQHRQKELDARSARLGTAQQQSQSRAEDLKELQADVDEMTKEVAALDEQIARAQTEAHALANHPDPEVRVTHELRARRTQWRKYAEAEFTRADVAANNLLSIDEFYMYYYAKLCFRFPIMRHGVNPGAALFNIYVHYCSSGRGMVGQGRSEEMLSHQFAKLCKDAKLINNKNLTKADVDIIYHSARAADEALETYVKKAGVAATARMYYPQFLFALDKIAQKRRSGFQEIVARLLSSVSSLPESSFADYLVLSGANLAPGEQVPEALRRPRGLPDNSGQLADAGMIARLQEEANLALSLSTGMCPGTTPHGTLKDFLAAKRAASEGSAPQAQGQDPAQAHVHGHAHGHSHGGSPHTPRGSAMARASVYGTLPRPDHRVDHSVLRDRGWEKPEPEVLQQSVRGTKALHSPSTLHVVRELDPDTLMVGLKRCFEAYNAWNNAIDRSGMDKVRWHKLLRDTQMVSESGSLPGRKADAIYAKVLPASSRSLNYIQFIEALRHVALTLRVSLNEVMERIVAVGGPQP